MQVPFLSESQVKNAPIDAGPRAKGMPAEDFGAGLGAGLQHFGNSALDIASEYNKQQDQTAAFDYRVSLDDHETAIKFGDQGENIEGQDPQFAEGFLKIQGSESMQYKDAYLEDFKARAFDSIPKDARPHVRAQLERMAEERYNNLANEFNKRAIAEESSANDAATGMMQASILRNIGLNPYDDKRFNTELGILEHTVDASVTKKYGENNPEANAIRASMLELARNDAYSKRINAIMMDDPAKAQQFLIDNTGVGTFTPETVKHFTDILRPLVENQDGINLAYEVIPRLKAGEPVDALIAEVQGKTKTRPGIFKVAEAQIRAAEADIHNANVQGAQRAAMPIQQLIISAERDGGKADPAAVLNSREYKSLVALGTPEALTLAAGYSDKLFTEHKAVVTEQRQVEREKRADRNEARREAKFDAATAKQERDQVAQIEFTRLSLNPDEVASMSQFEIQEKQVELGKTYGAQLLNLKQKLSSPEVLATVKLENKSFTALLGAMGITAKEKVAAYYPIVQDYLVSQQKEGQRVFNPEQVRKAVVAAFQDVEVNTKTKDWIGSGYSDSGTVTKKRVDVQNIESIVIPKEDLVTVKAFLKSNNFDDTPKNRVRVYDRILSDRGAKKIKSR